MFTIIVCSINPDAANALRKNIEETIGVPFEYIVFDNRTAHRGICSIYNECARRAKYDMLCFMHEDVEFRTQNWGKTIALKMREPDCGVIGFAGSFSKLSAVSGFGALREHTRMNYYQGLPSGKTERKAVNPDGKHYSPVVCIDGMCLMVRKGVWEQSRFDEVLLSGFHAYDLDFTMAVACNYRNYVCNIVEVYHASIGNFSREWFEAVRLCHDKWRGSLPMFADNKGLTCRQIDAMECKAEMLAIKFMLKRHVLSRWKLLQMTLNFVGKYPYSKLSYLLLIKFSWYIL